MLEEEAVPSTPEALGLLLGEVDGSELADGARVAALLSLVEGESLGVGMADAEGAGDVVVEAEGATLAEVEAHGEPVNDAKGLEEALLDSCPLADTDPLTLSEGATVME